MPAEVMHAAWFAQPSTSDDLPAPAAVLAYEGFTLVATAVAADCDSHGQQRIARAAHATAVQFGQPAADAVRCYLERVYQPGSPLDPREFLPVPGFLDALRLAVAGVYCELDGGTHALVLARAGDSGAAGS